MTHRWQSADVGLGKALKDQYKKTLVRWIIGSDSASLSVEVTASVLMRSLGQDHVGSTG
jgi:hypothetical protein